MKDSARYLKLVEWSDEDGCFVGQCPGIIGPCCHGDDEATVYAELCQIVEEWIETMNGRGQPLPPPTIRRNIVGKILSEVSVKPGEFVITLGIPETCPKGPRFSWLALHS